MAPKVALLGASGYTGRLVAKELNKRGIEFVACGRNAENVKRVMDELKISTQVETFDASNPQSVEGLFERLKPRLVITTVGPFLEFGKNVAISAEKSKASYIDSSGEQAFIKWVYENIKPKGDEQIFVPSLAFEYALADLGAELLKEKIGEPLTIRSFYYIPSFSPSRGTRASMLKAMEEKVLAYKDGELVEAVGKTASVTIAEASKTFDAILFPGGEPVMIPKHVAVDSVESYMVMSLSSARLLYRTAKEAKDKAQAILTEKLGPDENERKKNRFFIILEGSAKSEQSTLKISGFDAYGITAHLIAHGAESILAGKVQKRGVCTPTESFGKEALLNWCKNWGISFGFET